MDAEVIFQVSSMLRKLVGLTRPKALREDSRLVFSQYKSQVNTLLRARELLDVEISDAAVERNCWLPLCIPDETVLHIINKVLEDIKPRDYYKMLLNLSLVSQQWRAVINSNPALWHILSSSFSPSQMERILERSKDASLSVVTVKPSHKEELEAMHWSVGIHRHLIYNTIPRWSKAKVSRNFLLELSPASQASRLTSLELCGRSTLGGSAGHQTAEWDIPEEVEMDLPPINQVQNFGEFAWPPTDQGGLQLVADDWVLSHGATAPIASLNGNFLPILRYLVLDNIQTPITWLNLAGLVSFTLLNVNISGMPINSVLEIIRSSPMLEEVVLRTVLIGPSAQDNPPPVQAQAELPHLEQLELLGMAAEHITTILEYIAAPNCKFMKFGSTAECNLQVPLHRFAVEWASTVPMKKIAICLGRDGPGIVFCKMEGDTEHQLLQFSFQSPSITGAVAWIANLLQTQPSTPQVPVEIYIGSTTNMQEIHAGRHFVDELGRLSGTAVLILNKQIGTSLGPLMTTLTDAYVVEDVALWKMPALHILQLPNAGCTFDEVIGMVRARMGKVPVARAQSMDPPRKFSQISLPGYFTAENVSAIGGEWIYATVNRSPINMRIGR